MTTCENIGKRYRGTLDGAKAISRRDALALLIAVPWAAWAAQSAEQRLPRERLLLYRARSGEIRAATRPTQWRRRRAEIVRGFESIAGPFPGGERRCPLSVAIEEEVDCGDFVRQRITYQSEPGARVPAYLLVPRQALAGHRCPAALCLHQTHRAGQKVVVGLGESPDDEYAVELARRGFVCLAPPYPLLADYHPDVFGLGYVSGTMKAIWDNVRGLDVLASLPYVRGRAFAAMGHSLGGHDAIFTALFEDRLRVIVTSCAFDSFVDYMKGDITGWTQDRYLPRLRAYLGQPENIPFDFYELIGALAPRALFANAPLGDSNFQWQSVDRIATAAAEVYRMHRVADRLVVRHPDCGHRFPPPLRQEAYAFIEKHLFHG